jgi:hypothetical protein
MRRAIAAAAACLVSTAASSLEPGRWRGIVSVPDRPLVVVLDLARGEGDRWVGSIVLPGLGLKGAPLSNVAVDGRRVWFDLGSALAVPPHASASFELAVDDQGALIGTFRQGGNAAAASLRRTGVAQVEAPPQSTPVHDALAGRWIGRYELGGYPRNVTIEIRNQASGGARAEWTIVGKQTTRLPVDFVVQDGEFVRVESTSFRATFEGRYLERADELRGTIELGALALPIALRRAGVER